MSAPMLNVFPENKAFHDRAEIQILLESTPLAEDDYPTQAFRRPVCSENRTGFETITKIDANTIKKMMKKVNWIDLLTALTWAEKSTQETVLKCMTNKSREISVSMIQSMERGLLERHAIERARAVVSDAFLELMRE
jgi:hypothetical protein